MASSTVQVMKSETAAPENTKATLQPAVKTKDLAPRGDIVLVAGSPPTLKIKVSFDQLTGASPVFKRMLGGRFVEGQVKRSPEKPQNVPLPDDDAQAVSDMCHLLYHKVNKLVEALLGAERLYHLVLVTDKYDCLNILRLQIRALMQKHLDGLSKLKWEKSALRAGVAWLLGDAKFFEITTGHLIAHYNEPVSGLRKLTGGSLVPLNALLAMAEKRGEAQRKISADLSNLGSSGCDCGCCSDETDYREELIGMFDLMSWPPRFGPAGVSISPILDRLKGVKYSMGARSYDCSSEAVDRRDLWEVAEEVDRICRGLCLSCVREDTVEALQQSCEHAKKNI